MNTELVAKLKILNEELAVANKTVTDLKSSKKVIEQQLIDEMNSDGLSLARTDFGTVSISKTDIASVKDWAAFEAYIYENQALYLMQRRPSNPAYREEIETKGEIPGVETFTTTALSLTNKVT